MLLPAIALGLAGSMHCVGMCGPISLAVPVGKGSAWHRLGAYATYHFGRIAAYACLGFLFGTLGYGLSLGGMQQGLSIGTGVFMLAFIWMPRLAQLISGGGIVCRLQGKVTTAMAGLLRQHRAPALLGLGFLNGLLPCGLVYLALAGALVSYHPAQGALFMAAFGLGTVPALLGVALSGNVVGITWRSSLRKLAPLLATAIAILFIIRGLGLGIPYLSPELGPAITATHACDTLD